MRCIGPSLAVMLPLSQNLILNTKQQGSNKSETIKQQDYIR